MQPLTAEVVTVIPFHDVDAMEVAWHGHYAKYLEIARCALFNRFTYNYAEMRASGYAWPVIDMRIRYARPLRFQQHIRVKARLVEWEHRLKISYLIEDAKTSQRMARAYTVQIAVDIRNGEMQYASPKILYDKLGIEG